MTEHNPFAHFHNRERAAGHRPKLPKSDSESGNKSAILDVLRRDGPMTIAAICDTLRPMEEGTARQALFDLRKASAVREAGRVGDRKRAKIWEAVQ